MMMREPEASPGQASPAAPPQHLEPTCVYRHTHTHTHTHTHICTRARAGQGRAGGWPGSSLQVPPNTPELAEVRPYSSRGLSCGLGGQHRNRGSLTGKGMVQLRPRWGTVGGGWWEASERTGWGLEEREDSLLRRPVTLRVQTRGLRTMHHWAAGTES